MLPHVIGPLVVLYEDSALDGPPVLAERPTCSCDSNPPTSCHRFPDGGVHRMTSHPPPHFPAVGRAGTRWRTSCNRTHCAAKTHRLLVIWFVSTGKTRADHEDR